MSDICIAGGENRFDVVNLYSNGRHPVTLGTECYREVSCCDESGIKDCLWCPSPLTILYMFTVNYLTERGKNLMIQINDTFDIESTKVGRSCKRLSLCRSSFYILLSSCLLVICYRRAKACFSWIWIHRYIYHLQLWRFYLETLKTDSSVSRPEFCLYLFTYHGDLSKTVWVQSKSLTAAPY